MPGRERRFLKIEEIVAADPGGRGVGSLRRPGELESAAAALHGAERVVITSGFYIPSAGICETDGPPGALALGSALEKLGTKVTYLTDSFCLCVFEAAGFEALLCYEPGCLREISASVLVAIERAGPAADGRYYDLRARDITEWTAPIDELFSSASEHGWVTIGIGDGGNEIGMGSVRSQVERSITHGSQIACVVPTDHLVVAGTSNWGAWGLVAGLSLLVEQNLLPTADEAREHLDLLVSAGAVDGLSGRPEPTVDGLDWDRYLSVLEDLRP